MNVPAGGSQSEGAPHPLRILLVGDARNPHIVRWAQGFQRQQCEVGLMTMRAPAVELKGLPVWSLEHEPATFDAPAGALVKANYLRAVPTVRRAVREFKPDVTNVHFASSYGLLAHLANVRPRVVSVWGSDVYEFPAKSAFHRSLLTRILDAADAVTATSAPMAAHTRSMTTQPVEVINFGVDPIAFSPGPERSRPLTIGTARILRPKYGVDNLIRAFAELSGRHPSWRLRIAGDGPQRDELHQLAKTLNLTSSLEFVGQLAPSEMPAFMQSIDIFAALSVVESESFGVALLEAGATGLPVVASRIGGLPSVVKNGETGFLVPPGDLPSSVAALEQLGMSDQLRQSMGDTARERVTSRFNLHTNVEQMLSQLRSVAGHA